jgi:hypothetical protein
MHGLANHMKDIEIYSNNGNQWECWKGCEVVRSGPHMRSDIKAKVIMMTLTTIIISISSPCIEWKENFLECRDKWRQ